MEQTERLGTLIKSERANAALAWLLVAFVASMALESFPEDLVWMAFSVTVVAIVVVPPVAYRNLRAMLPWEVLALVALPVFGRAFATPGLSTDVATYLSFAALALVLAVEMDVFTTVGMTNWFAVLFVVIATMAAAGFWTLAQWLSDVFLETTFILPAKPPLTPTQEDAALQALMWDFVAATVAGLAAGVIFVLYFRRQSAAVIRLPPEVEEVIE